MSVFRSASHRLRKRDKSHRPPPLEGMSSKQESRSQTMDTPSSVPHLSVPESARSAFFTISSAVSSRASLFTRNSTSSDDKPRSFFKFSNLSRGSFVLRREREERKWNPFDDTVVTFPPIGDGAYVPKSRRSESASVSMANLLGGLDVIDVSAPPANSNVRQRSRTFSTRSASEAPNLPLRSLTLAPSDSSLDTSYDDICGSLPPRLGLNTSARSLSIELPSLSELSPTVLSPSDLDDILSPILDEPTIVVRPGLYSPAPTIISAMSFSTVQDSLMGSQDACSSESDPDPSFALGDDDCGPVPDSFIADERAPNSHQRASGSIDRILPRLTLTASGQTSPLEAPSQTESRPPSLPTPPGLHDIFVDPFESYFGPDNALDDLPIQVDSQPSPAESRTFVLEPRLDMPRASIHKLVPNVLRAGSTPPPRKLRIRKPDESTVAGGSSPTKPEESNSLLTVPPSPSTPSFLVGLDWPRPPLRQIYVDTQNPQASWHSVSQTVDERLIDGSGIVNTDPCHVIMLAQSVADTKGASETIGRSLGSGRRRGGMAMQEQQPLSLSAVSALAAFARRTPVY